MPFLTAHSAIGTADCASVKLVRTTKGEASVIEEVPAAITTSGTLAWVAIGAIASADRRQAEARQHGDLVVDDEFLRQPLGDVGHAGVVLEDHLDLLAGDRGAVARLVELHRGVDLLAGRGLLAGHRQDQADLDGVLREGARGNHGQHAAAIRSSRLNICFPPKQPAKPYLLGLPLLGKAQGQICFVYQQIAA